ncbi:MAG: hypothetical protein NT155_03630 [Candidatus Staskawiczbacteria bacterium]|nr:hypothetical protein [Candidatus Staskawiczbacteria bacterium]
MPILTIKIIVEADTPASKHLLNNENYAVFETKEDDATFAMVQRRVGSGLEEDNKKDK